MRNVDAYVDKHAHAMQITLPMVDATDRTSILESLHSFFLSDYYWYTNAFLGDQNVLRCLAAVALKKEKNATWTEQEEQDFKEFETLLESVSVPLLC